MFRNIPPMLKVYILVILTKNKAQNISREKLYPFYFGVFIILLIFEWLRTTISLIRNEITLIGAELKFHLLI